MLRKLPSTKIYIFCFFNVTAKSVDVQLNIKIWNYFFIILLRGLLFENEKKQIQLY